MLVLAWRWLLPALPFAALALRLARGLRVVRAFDRQRLRRSRSISSSRSPSSSTPSSSSVPVCVCVSDALHKPLGLLAAAGVALRLGFFLLAALASPSGLVFWLAQAPQAAFAALSANLALLLFSASHARQWPSSGSRGASMAVAAAGIVCLAFCVLVAVEVALLALARSAAVEQEKTLEAVAKGTFLYLAFMWTALGLLLLRVQGNAVRVLLGGDDRPPRAVSRQVERRIEIEPHKTLPPVFVMNLSLGCIWLALLLLLRGAYSAVVGLCCDPERLVHWLFMPGGAGSWHDFWAVLVLDGCWELLVLLVVVSLLKNMPIAVYAWPSAANLTESAAETEATDQTDESDDADETVSFLPHGLPLSPPRSSAAPVRAFRFQLPTVHELVQDYVIVTRRSLTRHQPEIDEAIYTYAHGEPERCLHQDASRLESPRSAPSGAHAEIVGSEFMECQCPTRHHDHDLLPEAQVPLLSDDDDSFEVIDAGSDDRSDDGQALLTPS